jgi:hypothetical protein
MGSDSVSAWFIALVGTIAGVVGAIAAVLQILQSRQGQARQTSNSAGYVVLSPQSIPTKQRTTLPGMSKIDESADDDKFTEKVTFIVLVASLWTVFILLILWLAIAILGIHSSTIPAYIIMAAPALAALGLGFYAVVGASLSLGELKVPAFLWNATAFVIDIMVVVTAIKVMT